MTAETWCEFFRCKSCSSLPGLKFIRSVLWLYCAEKECPLFNAKRKATQKQIELLEEDEQAT